MESVLKFILPVLLTVLRGENIGLELGSPDMYPSWLSLTRCLIVGESHHTPLPCVSHG